MTSRQEREERLRRELPHCAESDIAALAEIVERLIVAYEPQRIYLFGSKARGDHGPDSDFDLLVVVPDDSPPERKRSRLAYERLWGTATASDVLVWTQNRFDGRIHLRASLPGTVLREGRLLYAAAQPLDLPPIAVEGGGKTSVHPGRLQRKRPARGY
jgi:uncharacterized protein